MAPAGGRQPCGTRHLPLTRQPARSGFGPSRGLSGRAGGTRRKRGALLRLGAGAVSLPAAGCHFEKTKPGKGNLRPFPGFVVFSCGLVLQALRSGAAARSIHPYKRLPPRGVSPAAAGDQGRRPGPTALFKCESRVEKEKSQKKV